MTEKVKYAAIKRGVFPFFPLRMTWRWTAGTEPDNLCQLCISVASVSAIVKVRENGWTPPLILGTLEGIRVNTRTRTSVISPFLSAPLVLYPFLLFLCCFLYSDSRVCSLPLAFHFSSAHISLSLSHTHTHTHTRTHTLLSFAGLYRWRMNIMFFSRMCVCVCVCVWMPRQLTAAG